ncbi:MAG: hypothetical protein AMXMBFR79_06620 [Chitinophagaceae bacterium]|nr:hypothetical protein [Chitinophagaceae bacterium]MCZ2299376.1 hypothetical protein [Chitinophagales bacterium]
MEKEFSANDSIALIEEMINKAKSNFSDDSFLYLLWGWVIFICSVGHFLLLKSGLVKNPEYIWVLTWIAVLVQIFYIFKVEKKKRVKTYTDEIIGYLWMTFGFTMFFITIILGYTSNWVTLYPLLLFLYGTPTFLSGVIIKFMPLKIGGISCWILAFVAKFTPNIYILLLLALAVIAAWIIPGYLLKIKFKKDKV